MCTKHPAATAGNRTLAIQSAASQKLLQKPTQFYHELDFTSIIPRNVTDSKAQDIPDQQTLNFPTVPSC
jgi:hypothetical protein